MPTSNAIAKILGFLFPAFVGFTFTFEFVVAFLFPNPTDSALYEITKDFAFGLESIAYCLLSLLFSIGLSSAVMGLCIRLLLKCRPALRERALPRFRRLKQAKQAEKDSTGPFPGLALLVVFVLNGAIFCREPGSSGAQQLFHLMQSSAISNLIAMTCTATVTVALILRTVIQLMRQRDSISQGLGNAGEMSEIDDRRASRLASISVLVGKLVDIDDPETEETQPLV
ncbi:hypothetical protein C8J56DRAFT_210277 [Mycena floridula]|nr:hypothetical protein C8J56DRAFT_210277 [Mycena floridula]